jgi:hypothetical protein
VTTGGTANALGDLWKTVAELDDMVLLENNYYLPLGFMVNEEMAAYVPGLIRLTGNPFLHSNDLFRRATGLDGDLFSMVDINQAAFNNYRINVETFNNGNSKYFTYERDPDAESGFLRFGYEIPQNGMYYTYCIITGKGLTPLEIHNNSQIISFYRNMTPNIMPAGHFKAGDILFIYSNALTTSESGYINVHAARFDRELFNEGFALLAAETMTLTTFTDTKITGHITTSKGGLLYTSIPYENGKWKAYIDGIHTEIVPVSNALIAVRLSPGSYTIEFRYHNRSFTAGLIISLVSLAVFAALILLDKLKLWTHQLFKQ